MVVELLDRAHQADIALLDQIHHRQTAPEVFLGDRDNQPQVGLDQVLARGLALAHQRCSCVRSSSA